MWAPLTYFTIIGLAASRRSKRVKPETRPGAFPLPPPSPSSLGVVELDLSAASPLKTRRTRTRKPASRTAKVLAPEGLINARKKQDGDDEPTANPSRSSLDSTHSGFQDHIIASHHLDIPMSSFLTQVLSEQLTHLVLQAIGLLQLRANALGTAHDFFAPTPGETRTRSKIEEVCASRVVCGGGPISDLFQESSEQKLFLKAMKVCLISRGPERTSQANHQWFA